MFLTENDRFNILHPDLCTSLRWKSQFVEVEGDSDPTSPSERSNLFWCMHTQNCLGPDGQVAEPGMCSLRGRNCHASNSTE